MLPRLHIFKSAFTHSDQVFLGLPLLLALGIVILVMAFMHEEERATCPNHLKRLVRRAAVTPCTPNIAQSVSTDTTSSSLTPQIQGTIDLSFWPSRCKSGTVVSVCNVSNTCILFLLGNSGFIVWMMSNCDNLPLFVLCLTHVYYLLRGTFGLLCGWCLTVIIYLCLYCVWHMYTIFRGELWYYCVDDV